MEDLFRFFLRLSLVSLVFIVPMRDGRLSSSFLSSSVNFPSFYRPYEGWKTKLITAWNLKIFISFYRPYEGWKTRLYIYSPFQTQRVFIVPMRDGRLEGKTVALVMGMGFRFYRPYEGWKTLIGKKDLMSGELFLSFL